MSVAVSSKALPPLRTQAGIAGGIVLLIAASLAIATYFGSDLATAVGDAASEGLSNIKTVAAMLADRSPGQRPGGALASLKHKRQPALHERALPKVRDAVPPESPLASIVAPPPSADLTPLPPPPGPLFATVGGPPVAVPPVTIPGGGTPGGGTAGGPPGLTDIPPPGGGGGGVVVPPPITTAEVPPVTSSVPEPGTWTLMLVGFGLIGWTLRRDRRRVAKAIEA